MGLQKRVTRFPIINTQTATAESELANSQGYKPGKVYTGDQNKFDAKGEALPGDHWDYKKKTDLQFLAILFTKSFGRPKLFYIFLRKR